MMIMASSAANAVIIDVFAKANSISGGSGASTGVFLTAGDAFTTTTAAGDLWNAGALPRWSNADGLTGVLLATGADESGQAAGTQIGVDFGTFSKSGTTLPYGTLVGSIDGNLFGLGTNFAGNAVATGELLLWYWDSNNGDNSEFIRVTINSGVRAIPEPATISLFALGLAGLGMRLQRKQS